MKQELWREILQYKIQEMIINGKKELKIEKNLKWKPNFIKINKLQKKFVKRSQRKFNEVKTMSMLKKWHKISKEPKRQRKWKRSIKINFIQNR